MREIKFRAWSKKSKTIRDNIFDVRLGNDEDYELMQFTGLKDKNGKEIYEGDIVKDKEGIIWQVYWTMGAFSIFCDTHNLSKSLKLKIKDKTKEDEDIEILNAWWVGVEVIGNIYENPELLKEDKEDKA